MARFAPTSNVKITTPARTSLAVVEASHPQRSAVAGRMRSSLKTVISMPSDSVAGFGLLVGNAGRLSIDGNRMQED
ncbi:hypothetical protein NtRootA4_25460 [Arthrobacter sp. NtRootA4]|nr:hypothetical protein NtRootA4_25460 [Arthrobacter sp. NtRootA4]